jgi:integrase
MFVRTLVTIAIALGAGIPLQAFAASFDAKPGAWQMSMTTLIVGNPLPPEALESMPPEKRAKVEEAMKARAGRPITITQKTCVSQKDLDQDRIVRRNPCSIDGAGKEDSHEREIVPLPVVFRIADKVPIRYRALVLLATFADLRWGELAGLRRENIDLAACEVRIVETLAEPDQGSLRPETPKSRAGRRTRPHRRPRWSR